ncbi:MAG TPA: hypothetical protein VMF59_07260 [Bacteroidota bacterium]|nr:hypothetical protein [Bacteroidota bacterium]
MTHASAVLDRRTEVLAFLKTRFPLYHRSNVFFRDIQYGIMLFLERNGIRAGYPESESIAHQFVAALVRDGILVAIDGQSWALNYPEYRTPVTKAPPAAKPAAPAPAAPRTAAKPAAEQESAQ